MLHQIPPEYMEFWRPVKTPPDMLVHLTTPQNKRAIFASGKIDPRDPAPRDWYGLSAVFMFDTAHPTFGTRAALLLNDHLLRRSDRIDSIWIEPKGQLFRCKDPARSSYLLSLHAIPKSCFKSVHPFACGVK